MNEKSKNPKWLKRIKALLQSDQDSDVDQLIRVLTRLEDKAAKVHSDLAQSSDPDEKAKLNDKLDLLSKYRRKGLAKLKELLDRQFD